MEKEEAALRTKTFINSGLTKKRNKVSSRVAATTLILGFACPFLSERIIFNTGFNAVNETRKELNVLNVKSRSGGRGRGSRRGGGGILFSY